MEHGPLLAIAALPVFPLFTPDGNRSAKCTDGGKLAGVLSLQDGILSYRTRLGIEFSCALAHVHDVKAPGAMGCRFGPGFELQCTAAERKYWFGPMAPLHPASEIDEVLSAIRPVAKWKKIDAKVMAGAAWEAARGLFLDDTFGPLVLAVSKSVDKRLEVQDPAAALYAQASANFKPAYAFRDALTATST